MKRILVAGVNGFVGFHLAAELARLGCRVVGLGTEAVANDTVQSLLDNYYQCDLTDQSAVAEIDLSKINAVINLAGLAKVGESFKNPELYERVNVEVLSVIGNRLAEINSRARIIAVSTGAVYGANQPMPLTEESSLVTNSSPYAQSKILMEKAAENLRKSDVDCVVVRPFNHIGPGQLSGFLLPDLYAKIKYAENNDGKISVGNLATKRDYTDVRDIVRAYVDLATSNNLSYKTYNVCSGISRSGEEVLHELLRAMKLSGKIQVETDEKLIRPDDPKDLYGDYARLQKDTGWQPKIAFSQTIEDFVTKQ